MSDKTCDVVEQDPIAVAGNCLVSRVSAGVFLGSPEISIESQKDLYSYYNANRTISDPMRISLPTDGLYAQTIMDECVVLKEHHGNQDWVLDDPDPELGALDSSLLTSRRAEPPKTDPTPFPATIINLTNSTPVPTPQGISGALNAVQNAGAFRDMAGLAGTQALATAAVLADRSFSRNYFWWAQQLLSSWQRCKASNKPWLTQIRSLRLFSERRTRSL